MSALWDSIAAAIGAASGEVFKPQSPRRVGGGDINDAYTLDDGRRRWFIKLNAATRIDMFAAEVDGLREIAATGALRVPQPLCHGSAAGRAYLVLEWLDLSGRGNQEKLAHRLADLHRHTRADYGWFRDNTIGATVQPNAPCADWAAFWRERRLGHQLTLAAGAGNRALIERGEALLARLPEFFSGYTPAASLLHGDLWAGNAAATAGGEPVIFDPAVYYGDREADLAMTELFGGFSERFYAAYREAWPLDPGYERRKTLYNLYHVLNHYHLFGGGYGQQAVRMMERLLGELRA